MRERINGSLARGRPCPLNERQREHVERVLSPDPIVCMAG